MAFPLSLHQLTALDAPPDRLIRMAGALGCASVCLFTFVPEQARHIYPLVRLSDVPMIGEALAAGGVTLCNLEVFPLDRDGDLERFAEALETGATLGAQRATAHLHDAHGTQATARFHAFAELAAGYGIEAGLEFNAFSAIRTAADAARIVRAAGFGSVVLDMLHLVRAGEGPADVASVADLIGYAQICDGPAAIEESARWREAVGERALPGHGAFPLRAILAALGPETVIEVEVPQSAARKAGATPEDRAKWAVEAARTILAARGDPA